MNVSYKCTCMAKEVTVAVPDRPDEQDIVDWVGVTAANALGEDHRKRSPHCPATKVEFMKFEVDPTGSTPMGRLPLQ